MSKRQHQSSFFSRGVRKHKLAFDKTASFELNPFNVQTWPTRHTCGTPSSFRELVKVATRSKPRQVAMAAQSQTFLLKDPFPGVSRSSSWSTIGSSNSHQHTKSNNPFRQRPDLGKEQDENPSLRKKTPIRAVFDDLLTAHSSITSGKTNTQVKDGAEPPQDEDSLHLEELDVVERPTDFLINLPLRLLPFGTSEPRQWVASNQVDQGNDNQSHAQLWQNFHPVAFELPKFMFTSARNEFAAISSLTKDDACDGHAASLWPRDSLDLDDNIRRRSLKAILSYANQKHIIQPSQLNGSLEGSEQLNNKNQNASECLVYRSGLAKTLPGTKTHLVDLSLSPAHPKPLLLRHVSDVRTVSDDGSPREGSTVGNIYNHYIRSDEMGGFGNGDYISNSGQCDPRSTSPGAAYRAGSLKLSPKTLPKGQTNSSTMARRQGRRNKSRRRNVEQRLLFSPPKFAESEAEDRISSLARDLTNPSSCGDTHDFLRLGWPACPKESKIPMSRVEGHYGLVSSAIASDGEVVIPNTPNGYDLRNPFQTQCLSQNSIPPVANRDPYTAGQEVGLLVPDRLPLEREVSEALRRASGLSAYSNESFPSSTLEHYTNLSVASTSRSVGILTRHKPKGAVLSDSKTMSEGTKALAEQAKAFYDQDAISLHWLTTHPQNVVRIPIKHNRAMSDTPSTLPTIDTILPQGLRHPTPEDDRNDWETIGESGFGLDNRSIKDLGLIGGTINRAGSSLANTSDEGTASPCIPEIQDFGSTERIAQHPGHIRYFGDYRQRDLKKTRIPIFLPVFREHKVNGYLADSTRFRPSPPHFDIGPPQLPKTHTNPFRSSPPKVTPVKRLSKRGRHLNHFQHSLGTLRTEQDSGTGGGGVESNTEHLHSQHDWMDNFGEPGPTISNRDHGLQIPSLKRPSSWRYIMGLASQREGNGNKNGDGNNSSFTVDNSSQSGVNDVEFHSKVNAREGALVDKTVQNAPPSGRDLPSNAQRRAPLVKGLPGAFYKGLQAQAGESKRKSRSESGRVILNASNGCSSVSDYPTNELRPLSLLRHNRPCTPIIPTEQHPSENVLENDFVYRSPLAPPKRDSWKQLYSTQQMQGILDAAKADRVVESQTRPTAGFSQSASAKESGSHKHLFETPTLRLWRRDESTRTDLTYQKTKFSIIVLCFCALFPPMLMLYAWGRLDGIIQWLTDGTYSSFAKKQKKWAILLMCCWGVAVFLGLVAFLVYWFAGLHSR